ncbi:SGNH/GDSL hydrolase family protein [Nocardioides flavescens]|uniref:SGNH hydrolase-type esterase domain-containing protein n=1 Tax=Nocardioides flavescens TaxID=2691959 RepID=A0A6L7EYY8_9ACTN|nr:hypothetical protein [Nocardioides flavescens]MXG88742.1 hypothetical protein [Nocardioides flavescens]
MPISRTARSWLAWLVVVATVLALAPDPARAQVSSQVTSQVSSTARTDSRIGPTDCRLLGRVYVGGQGCSRDRCVPGARIAKAARGAELCALRGQGDHAFGAPVDYRLCAQLHRRWVAQVNWCAANPDRGRAVITHAPQCTGTASTYVTHSDRAGAYDECRSPGDVRRLREQARQRGTTLEREARETSAVICSTRPGHRFTDGRCERGHDPADTPGGVLLVGDSIAWRGQDELGTRWPDAHLDGIPSRRLDDLRPRLDAFEADHGAPDGLVVELGTNAARGFRASDLRAVLDTLPARTPVMLVLPYRADPHRPAEIQPASTRTARWMRRLATDRPATCVADWRGVVAARPGVLVDGVHPTSSAETFWAEWIVRSWRSCGRDVRAGGRRS